MSKNPHTQLRQLAILGMVTAAGVGGIEHHGVARPHGMGDKARRAERKRQRQARKRNRK